MKNGDDLLLSIGEFSKICKVSTKTLRYYEEIGLLNPDEINTKTGYRYYSIGQLKKMTFINRLKSYNIMINELKGKYNLSGSYSKPMKDKLNKSTNEQLSFF